MRAFRKIRGSVVMLKFPVSARSYAIVRAMVAAPCEIGHMSAKKLSVGDRVEWDTAGGKTTGRVEKKLTKPMKIKTHKVAASPKNPEYLVRTEKSQKLAAHKPTELRKASR